MNTHELRIYTTMPIYRTKTGGVWYTSVFSLESALVYSRLEKCGALRRRVAAFSVSACGDRLCQSHLHDISAVAAVRPDGEQNEYYQCAECLSLVCRAIEVDIPRPAARVERVRMI